MNKALKLIPMGNSTGLILPKDVLARLRVGQGDAVSISETPGGIEIRPCEPGCDEQMAVARAVMKRRRLALRELAK